MGREKLTRFVYLVAASHASLVVVVTASVRQGKTFRVAFASRLLLHLEADDIPIPTSLEHSSLQHLLVHHYNIPRPDDETLLLQS